MRASSAIRLSKPPSSRASSALTPSCRPMRACGGFLDRTPARSSMRPFRPRCRTGSTRPGHWAAPIRRQSWVRTTAAWQERALSTSTRLRPMQRPRSVRMAHRVASTRQGSASTSTRPPAIAIATCAQSSKKSQACLASIGRRMTTRSSTESTTAATSPGVSAAQTSSARWSRRRSPTRNSSTPLSWATRRNGPSGTSQPTPPFSIMTTRGTRSRTRSCLTIRAAAQFARQPTTPT